MSAHWLRRLLDPDADVRAKRDADMRAALGDLTSTVERLTAQVGALDRRFEQQERSSAGDLRRAAADLQRQSRRQAGIVNRLLKQSGGDRYARREAVLRRLTHVAARRGAVIVGPWTGEVGFELLYWAPFVRWALRRFRIAPERVTIVSRGGTASWYGIDGAGYLDVFDLVSPEEFRAGTTGETKKQRTAGAFDRRLLRLARHASAGASTHAGGAGDISLLHPALMYTLFMPYWKQQESVARVTDAAEFARLAPPRVAGLAARLPRDYVAARFYFSDCFPDTATNRAVVGALMQSLSADVPVVLLGPGIRVDDHEDVTTDAAGRIIAIDDLMRPADNLAVQTAAIAGARAFIGTYGGFSYLAPLCGVPTVAVYSVYNYFAHHLEMARVMFDKVGASPFTAVDVAALPLLRHLAAEAAAAPAATPALHRGGT
jgi:hypothetical protein